MAVLPASVSKGWLLGAAAGVGLLLAISRGGSSSGPGPTLPHGLPWPVPRELVTRLGQSVMADRNGKGEVHEGFDVFVPAGTEVRAVAEGTVLRVIDGRDSREKGRRRAGLWIDLRAGDLLYRYLHLGDAKVKRGDRVRVGQVLGHVAPPHTSGLAEDPHLHFEIRTEPELAYGDPIDPRSVLAA